MDHNKWVFVGYFIKVVNTYVTLFLQSYKKSPFYVVSLEMRRLLPRMLNITLLFICLSTSPILISIGLTLTAIVLCTIILWSYSDLWPVSILAVAFIGGVIVLYVYVSSMAQNEMTTFNPLILLLLPIILVITQSKTTISTNYNLASSAITDLYSIGAGTISISCMVILLLALIIVCRVIQFWKGSLRDIS